MPRYRVRVTATFDVDNLPGVSDPDNAARDLEGVTTTEFLRLTDAYQHARIYVSQHSAAQPGLERTIARKRGLGGWE